MARTRAGEPTDDDLRGKPYENEHAARIRAPGLFVRVRELWRIPEGVRGIGGPLKSAPRGGTVVQAIHFDRKKFTVAQARKWLKDHDYTPILFERATGKEDDMGEAALAGAETVVDPTERTISSDLTYERALRASHVEPKRETPVARHGSVEGYASAFDVIDHQQEVIRKGAFTKTIAEQKGKIVLSARHFGHGGDVKDAVGVIEHMEEDDYGLRFRATYFKDKTAQEVREKINEMRAKGVQIYSSIGYRPMRYGFIKDEAGRTILEHTEIALKEITLTLNPANEGAVITGSKGNGAAGEQGSEGTAAPDTSDAAAPTEAKPDPDPNVGGDGGAEARGTAADADSPNASQRAKDVRRRLTRIKAGTYKSAV